jgi:hypothetical protein
MFPSSWDPFAVSLRKHEPTCAEYSSNIHETSLGPGHGSVSNIAVQMLEDGKAEVLLPLKLENGRLIRGIRKQADRVCRSLPSAAPLCL